MINDHEISGVSLHFPVIKSGTNAISKNLGCMYHPIGPISTKKKACIPKISPLPIWLSAALATVMSLVVQLASHTSCQERPAITDWMIGSSRVHCHHCLIAMWPFVIVNTWGFPQDSEVSCALQHRISPGLSRIPRSLEHRWQGCFHARHHRAWIMANRGKSVPSPWQFCSWIVSDHSGNTLKTLYIDSHDLTIEAHLPYQNEDFGAAIVYEAILLVMFTALLPWSSNAARPHLRTLPPKNKRNQRTRMHCTWRITKINNVKNVLCKVWNVECQVWSVKCKVWSVKCGVWSVKCRVWSVECKV